MSDPAQQSSSASPALPAKPKRQKPTLQDRIQGDLERGDLALARRRLESRLQIETHAGRADELRGHLIQVLIQMGDPERAGMYAMLLEAESASLNDLRTVFIRRCGGAAQAVRDRIGPYRTAIGPKAKDRLDQLFIDLVPFKTHPGKWRKINLNESKGTFIFLGIMVLLIYLGFKGCGL